jgi:hypothetical protein
MHTKRTGIIRKQRKTVLATFSLAFANQSELRIGRFFVKIRDFWILDGQKSKNWATRSVLAAGELKELKVFFGKW